MIGAGETPDLPDLAAIRDAAARIAGHVHDTPVMTCAAIDAEAGASLFFKSPSKRAISASGNIKNS